MEDKIIHSLDTHNEHELFMLCNDFLYFMKGGEYETAKLCFDQLNTLWNECLDKIHDR